MECIQSELEFRQEELTRRSSAAGGARWATVQTVGTACEEAQCNGRQHELMSRPDNFRFCGCTNIVTGY